MATNGKMISLGEILWKVLRKPIIKDLTIEEAAEYAVEFLRLVGAPVVYTTIPEIITIEDYRGKLPSGLLYVEGVRLKSDACLDTGIVLRESSDTFHLSVNKITTEFTYKLQNNHIYTSFSDGIVEIIYKKIATDKDGYPLIEDNIKVIKGVEAYIIYMYIDGLHDIGKITDKVYEKYHQQYLYYIGAANSSLQLPNQDKAATIFQGLNKLIQNVNHHETGYRNFGEIERFKKT